MLLVDLGVALQEALEVHEERPADEHEESVHVNSGQVDHHSRVGAAVVVVVVVAESGDHLVGEDLRDIGLEEPEVGHVGVAVVAVAAKDKHAVLAVEATRAHHVAITLLGLEVALGGLDEPASVGGIEQGHLGLSLLVRAGQHSAVVLLAREHDGAVAGAVRDQARHGRVFARRHAARVDLGPLALRVRVHPAVLRGTRSACEATAETATEHEQLVL